jgi:hypothetical protein
MEPEQTKIGIETSYDDTDEVEVEFPWADHLGENRYRIKNFPFFAYGVSFDDIVEAELKYDDDPYPYLIKVVEKSGHKTLRIILDESAKESDRSRNILDHLASMECGYEGTDGEKYFVINVQPQCDFDAVRDYLNNENVQWEYADPTYDQIHANDT